MFTKEMLCKCVCEKFAMSNNIHIDGEDYSPLVPHVMESTRLGISLQFLGYIKEGDELNDYFNSRGGILAVHANPKKDVNILCFRDILNLLPDILPEENTEEEK